MLSKKYYTLSSANENVVGYSDSKTLYLFTHFKRDAGLYKRDAEADVEAGNQSYLKYNIISFFSCISW